MILLTAPFFLLETEPLILGAVPILIAGYFSVFFDKMAEDPNWSAMPGVAADSILDILTDIPIDKAVGALRGACH